jgi:hypothetical protein
LKPKSVCFGQRQVLSCFDIILRHKVQQILI